MINTVAVTQYSQNLAQAENTHVILMVFYFIIFINIHPVLTRKLNIYNIYIIYRCDKNAARRDIEKFRKKNGGEIKVNKNTSLYVYLYTFIYV